MSVYLDYFGLRQAPFALTPDPVYVYLSRRHEDALAHLLYGIGQGGSGGFVQLTGEVGTGKTTLCRCLLEQIPENTRIALILNPMLSPLDLLQAICDELAIHYERDFSRRELVNALNSYLLDVHGRGERVVLVIDEAQNLQPEALEQVRLLTNLETHTDKLLQIILLGQPELRELLNRPDLRQLSQRITARYHLEPLDYRETVGYIRHRLRVAGREQPLFTRGGYRALYRLSHGVPRLINIYADRALMGAYARDADRIGAHIIHRACGEIGQRLPHARRRYRWIGAAAVAGLMLAGLWWWQGRPPADAPGRQTAALSAADSEAPVMPEPATGLAGAADAGGQSSWDDWLETASPTDLWDQWAMFWNGRGEHLRRACDDRRRPDRAGMQYVCTTLYGGWGRIRQLQLPVVIMLEASTAVPVLVEDVTDEAALLHNGHSRRWTPLARVSRLWTSEQFTAVCPGQDRAWTVGDENRDIERLKQQAASLLLQPWQGRVDPVYDRDFAAWVGRFQMRNGLTVDRVIGTETRLYLCAENLETAARVDAGSPMQAQSGRR